MGWYGDAKELLRDLTTIAEKADKLDLQRKLVQLGQAMLEGEQERLELAQENQALRQKLEIAAEVDFDGSAYWRKRADAAREGPYCQRCYDADARLIRLQTRNQGWWHCEHCDKSYHKADAPQEPGPLRRRGFY